MGPVGAPPARRSIRRFAESLRKALEHRRRMRMPELWGVVTIVVCLTLTSIILSLRFVPPGRSQAYHFIDERGAMTLLSAAFLAIAGAFSTASAVTLARAAQRGTGLWILLALGFAFLAGDELLQFHERVGDLIGRAISPGVFRNWNDVIVLLYGVIAAPVMALLLPVLLRFRSVVELFIVAFIFYALHTGIDATQEPRTTASAILEESAKVLSGAFLALGALAGFLGIVWSLDLEDRRDEP